MIELNTDLRPRQILLFLSFGETGHRHSILRYKFRAKNPLSVNTGLGPRPPLSACVLGQTDLSVAMQGPRQTVFVLTQGSHDYQTLRNTMHVRHLFWGWSGRPTFSNHNGTGATEVDASHMYNQGNREGSWLVSVLKAVVLIFWEADNDVVMKKHLKKSHIVKDMV